MWVQKIKNNKLVVVLEVNKEELGFITEEDEEIKSAYHVSSGSMNIDMRNGQMSRREFETAIRVWKDGRLIGTVETRPQAEILLRKK
jgi:hypothetical protein